MSSKSTQSEACCNTPAVVSKGYTPKGDYIQVDGLKTCKYIPVPHQILTFVLNIYTDATGPSDAKLGILVVYDIFGFFNQTLQGADILAHTDDQKYQVFMPDFFEGKPADISWCTLDLMFELNVRRNTDFVQTRRTQTRRAPSSASSSRRRPRHLRRYPESRRS